MNKDDLKKYINKNVILTTSDGDTVKGYLTNYVAELDDDDNLIQSIDLIPINGTENRYRYGFNLKEIKKIELQ